ncbi:MAG: NADH:ubiquinone reductase (Na(+)-transporting) subunit F [Fibrobacterales bacterium]
MMVVIGIIIFTVIILALVFVLLIAENKLVAQGEVALDINGDASLKKITSPGTTLLNALTNNDIFLPSACGGGGTCGMCTCQVLEGGGDILPTETGHINRKEAKEHWRLACQMKVKNDLKLQIPDEIFNIQEFKAKVKSNNSVSTYIKEFVIELPEGLDLNYKAGGYIQIKIPAYKDLSFKSMDIPERFKPEWDKFKMWDLSATNPQEMVRAYSMASYPAEKGIVMLNVRVCAPPWDRAKGGFADVPPGLASSYIFNLKEGDEVTVSGPYGEFYIQDTQNEMVYIGGGAGMAPLRSHIFHLFNTLKTGRKVTYYYGARSKKEIFYEPLFRAIEEQYDNFKFHIALSEPEEGDNWEGAVGFIHNVVHDLHLKDHETPEDIEYYMCGPPIMSDSVHAMLDNLGVEKKMIHADDFGI